MRRILREYPDPYGVQMLQETHAEARSRKRRGGRLSEADAQDLARLPRGRLARRTWIALVLIVGGSAALAGLVQSSRPESSKEVLDALAAEWSAGDWPALSRRFVSTDDDAAKSWDRFEKGPLSSARQPLGEIIEEDLKPTRGQRTWESTNGDVVIAVQLKGDRWTIMRFDPPLPPIGDLANELRSAWNANSASRCSTRSRRVRRCCANFRAFPVGEGGPTKPASWSFRRWERPCCRESAASGRSTPTRVTREFSEPPFASRTMETGR